MFILAALNYTGGPILVHPYGDAAREVRFVFCDSIRATGMGSHNESVVCPNTVPKCLKLLNLGAISPIYICLRCTEDTTLEVLKFLKKKLGTRFSGI
jgi:hypothetical protein